MYTYSARITDVYDGDSVTMDVDLGFSVTLHGLKFRIAQVDTPEIRGKSEKEKTAGKLVRDWVKKNWTNRPLQIVTVKDKTEKYGRYLAFIKDTKRPLEEMDLSTVLIKKGFAKFYEGSRREPWTEEQLDHIIKSLQL